MIDGTKEMLSILGLGVVGYIGSTILIDAGKKHLDVALNVILTIASTLIGLQFFYRGMRAVAAIFQLSF